MDVQTLSVSHAKMFLLFLTQEYKHRCYNRTIHSKRSDGWDPDGISNPTRISMGYLLYPSGIFL